MSIDVHTLAEQAAEHGMLTAEQVCKRFLLAIARNQAYLERRARRGVRTPTDEALALDCACMARAIELLRRG